MRTRGPAQEASLRSSERPSRSLSSGSPRNRRIVLVMPFANDHGGLEQYAADLATLARRRAWAVTVVAPYDIHEQTWLREQLHPLAQWVPADCAPRRLTVRARLLILRFLRRALAACGSESCSVGSLKCQERTVVARSFWSSIGRGLLHCADLVHVLGKPNAFACSAIRAAHAAGVPTVYSEIAQVDARSASRPRLIGIRDCINLAAVATVYSSSQIDSLRTYYGFRGRIEPVEQWLPHDLEARLLAIERSTAAPSAGPAKVTFGSLSRLGPEKGLMLLLRAFARFVPRAQGPVRMIIAGTGEERDELQATADTLGLARLVEFPGFVKDKALLLAEMDVLVVASYSEGGPISGVEAMAAGGRLLSTRVGAMPSRLSGCRDGLLVPTNDENALADGLSQMEKLCRASPPAGDLRMRFSKQMAGTLLREKMAGLWEDVLSQGN